jgi:hypothetical protein
VEKEVLILLVVGFIDEKLPEHFDVVDTYLNMCVADYESQKVKIGLDGYFMAIATHENLVTVGPNFLDDF